jgi:cytochrome c oxidase subunit 2
MRIILITLSILALSFFFSCQADFSTSEAFDRGHEVYLAHCVSCHGIDGTGNQGVYPSLANRGINEATTQRAISIISKGSALMKPIHLDTNEMIDIINYIQNNWGLTTPLINEEKLVQLSPSDK